MTIGVVFGTGIPTFSAAAGAAGIALGIITGGLLTVTAAALFLGSARRGRAPRRLTVIR